MDNIHILPVNDLKEHDGETLDCLCKPRIENETPPFVVIHNSADGREILERVNQA